MISFRYNILLCLIYFLSCFFPILIHAQTTIIEGILKLPDETPLKSTLLTLNQGEFSTYSTPTGAFSFYNIPPGVHLLDVHSHTHSFSQIKIQLLPESMNEPKCVEYIYPGAPKQIISYPLQLTAYATYEYFEPRPVFSPLVFLQNPMVLVMVASAALMFVMPRMMENLDPEQKEQMKKQMEMQQDPTKMLSQLWGDLSGTNAQPQVGKKKIKERGAVRRMRRE